MDSSYWELKLFGAIIIAFVIFLLFMIHKDESIKNVTCFYKNKSNILFQDTVHKPTQTTRFVYGNNSIIFEKDKDVFCEITEE
jgi:hypothetical protein